MFTLNKGHSLARGLSFAFLGPYFVDLVSGVKASVSLPLAAGSEGRAGESVSAGVEQAEWAWLPGLDITDRYTIIHLFERTGSEGSTPGIVFKRDTVASDGAWGLYDDGTDIRMFVRNGGSDIEAAFSGVGNLANGLQGHAVTFDGTAGGATLHSLIGGTFTSTNDSGSADVTGEATNTHDMCIGGALVGWASDHSFGLHYATLIYRRTLLPQQCRSLMQNPWQIVGLRNLYPVSAPAASTLGVVPKRLGAVQL